MNNTKKPFSIEISRIIEVLASQIYPSPLALLRENTQNSFDAILMRKHAGDVFEPEINIVISSDKIQVSDNGIGMSQEDLGNHYWHAGSSSKNNSEARAAGVVGTFGIGAMANFGIAEELVVVTESLKSEERTRSIARKSTLSVTDDCIDYFEENPVGEPGTTVTAIMQNQNAVNINQAKQYISEFVGFLSIKVTVNGEIVSQKSFDTAVPNISKSWSFDKEEVILSSDLAADVVLIGSKVGELQIELKNIIYRSKKLDGQIKLNQNAGGIRTFRSQFGLATISVSSYYQFGGIADFLFLEPTAGREALTTESMQVLQQIMTHIDEFVSLRLSKIPECDANTNFMSWVIHHGKYELCGNLIVRVEPDQKVSLKDLKERSKSDPLLMYIGNDPSQIAHASDDKPLVVVSRNNPRRQCEVEFLRQYCRVEEINDQPKVLKRKKKSKWTNAETALAFRISSILKSDYFLDAEVEFGQISHGLPVLVTVINASPTLCIDPSGNSAQILLNIYDKEYSSFGSMAKDFVRNLIFPRIADLVPSSTRQGAEAFLKAIQRNREVFEYELVDSDNLNSIWSDYIEGRLTMSEASEKSVNIAVRNIQVIDDNASAQVKEVVPDVIDNDALLKNGNNEVTYEAIPAIERLDIKTDCKLLIIKDDEEPLRGFRCFLAVTDRVREEKGDFFLQPHKTSIVWGGQKAVFIFEHHSGEFGLYYDIQTPDLVGSNSGGGTFQGCTMVMKNRIFIPIPIEIMSSFIPTDGVKKRLEIRCDILYTEK